MQFRQTTNQWSILTKRRHDRHTFIKQQPKQRNSIYRIQSHNLLLQINLRKPFNFCDKLGINYRKLSNIFGYKWHNKRTKEYKSVNRKRWSSDSESSECSKRSNRLFLLGTHIKHRLQNNRTRHKRAFSKLGNQLNQNYIL